ncbi:hypothetical protein GCM10022295_90340 [Streptomyces osmaniensis]|uniref:Uncharacterized protein n=1 Tax=Streptomyces osmaniensis TaxID=593134 RepID=A0ABP6Z1W1_9ACTN
MNRQPDNLTVSFVHPVFGNPSTIPAVAGNPKVSERDTSAAVYLAPN